MTSQRLVLSSAERKGSRDQGAKLLGGECPLGRSVKGDGGGRESQASDGLYGILTNQPGVEFKNVARQIGSLRRYNRNAQEQILL